MHNGLSIVRHGGVVSCAAVSPYRATRYGVRRMVGPDHFLEVFVDTLWKCANNATSKACTPKRVAEKSKPLRASMTLMSHLYSLRSRLTRSRISLKRMPA
jgi:hypothetical protein